MLAGQLLEQRTQLSTSGAQTCLAPLGLSAAQLRALLPSYEAYTMTPLELAVRCGAAEAAAELVAAGARRANAYSHLTSLAKALTAASGSDSAAANIPAAVQHVAEALLAGAVAKAPGDDPDYEMLNLHRAAVNLAHPSDGGYQQRAPFPPCPHLLQRLFQLHASGGPLAAAESAPAVNTVLRDLLGWGLQAAEAEVSQWLGVPAAGGLSTEQLMELCGRLCSRGMLAVLSALLEREDVRLQLRNAAASTSVAGWQHLEGATLVAAAAEGGGAALDAVLAAGGGVSLSAINFLLRGSFKTEGSVAALKLLLSRGVPFVPEEGEAAHPELCPIYALLNQLVDEQDRVSAPPAACPLDLLPILAFGGLPA